MRPDVATTIEDRAALTLRRGIAAAFACCAAGAPIQARAQTTGVDRPADAPYGLMRACWHRVLERSPLLTPIGFRVRTDASGYILGSPELLNPIAKTEAAERDAKTATRALLSCQPVVFPSGMSIPPKALFSRVVRFRPTEPALSPQIRSPDDTGNAPQASRSTPMKTDVRGLTLGTSKAATLSLLTRQLAATCQDLEKDGLIYTCNAVAANETYQVAFTVAEPATLRSVVYIFTPTHDRRTVIADLSRSFGRPSEATGRVDWATWSLGRATKLHLRGGGDDRYEVILDDDEIANDDYVRTQRQRNEQPPPRF